MYVLRIKDSRGEFVMGIKIILTSPPNIKMSSTASWLMVTCCCGYGSKPNGTQTVPKGYPFSHSW